jgi:hypothetical protein
MRNVHKYAPAGLVFAAHGAAAMELDTLIPPGSLGLGTPAPLTIIGAAQAADAPVPIQFGGFTLAPSLTAGFGYDTAPSAGADGSALFSIQPHLVAADPYLGFGAYLAANAQYLPSQPDQNISGYTVALGEAAVLPDQKLTIAAGYARAATTNFSLTAINPGKPLAYTVAGITAGDRIAAGMFTIAPEISYAAIRFDRSNALDFSQTRERTEIGYQPGGPIRLVTLFEATQSANHLPALNGASDTLLAGLDEDATGLWEFRLLAGAAWRLPAQGRPLTAPVLEAGAIWAPTELTRITADLLREVDDPDQLTPAGYTLTQADLSIIEEASRDTDISAGLAASHAGYFQGGLNQDLFTADAGITWHLNRGLALSAAYAFADRQANFARAANQHVFSLNAVWTP